MRCSDLVAWTKRVSNLLKRLVPRAGRLHTAESRQVTTVALMDGHLPDHQKLDTAMHPELLAELLAQLERLKGESPANALNAILESIGRFHGEDNADRFGYGFDAENRDAFRKAVVDILSKFPPEPRVLVIAGGSGSGKSTFTRMLLTKHPERFVWLRRTTTRLPRSKDPEEIDMHRFMDESEFAANHEYLYCVTGPYGYRYGFLLEDILGALLTRRIWLTNTLIQFGDLKKAWPQMDVRVIGLSPITILEGFSDDVKRELKRVIYERIRIRDEHIQSVELDARLEKSCLDTETVYRLADQMVVNETGVEREAVYSKLEAVALQLFSAN